QGRSVSRRFAYVRSSRVRPPRAQSRSFGLPPERVRAKLVESLPVALGVGTPLARETQRRRGCLSGEGLLDLHETRGLEFAEMAREIPLTETRKSLKEEKVGALA